MFVATVGDVVVRVIAVVLGATVVYPLNLSAEDSVGVVYVSCSVNVVPSFT